MLCIRSVPITDIRQPPTCEPSPDSTSIFRSGSSHPSAEPSPDWTSQPFSDSTFILRFELLPCQPLPRLLLPILRSECSPDSTSNPSFVEPAPSCRHRPVAITRNHFLTGAGCHSVLVTRTSRCPLLPYPMCRVAPLYQRWGDWCAGVGMSALSGLRRRR